MSQGEHDRSKVKYQQQDVQSVAELMQAIHDRMAEAHNLFNQTVTKAHQNFLRYAQNANDELLKVLRGMTQAEAKHLSDMEQEALDLQTASQESIYEEASTLLEMSKKIRQLDQEPEELLANSSLPIVDLDLSQDHHEAAGSEEQEDEDLLEKDQSEEDGSPRAEHDCWVRALRPSSAVGLAGKGLYHQGSIPKIAITDSGNGLSYALQKYLKVKGIKSEVVHTVPSWASLVIFLGGLKKVTSLEDSLRVAEDAFLCSKIASKFVGKNGGMFVCIFDSGLHRKQAGSTAQACLSSFKGLAQSAAAEWEHAGLKCIDIDQQGRSDAQLAACISSEIFEGGPQLDVVLKADGLRYVYDWQKTPQSAAKTPVFKADSTLIVFGIESEVVVQYLPVILGQFKSVVVVLDQVGTTSNSRKVHEHIQLLKHECESVSTVQVDLYDLQQVRKAMQGIGSKHGHLTLYYALSCHNDQVIEKLTFDEFHLTYYWNVKRLNLINEAFAGFGAMDAFIVYHSNSKAKQMGSCATQMSFEALCAYTQSVDKSNLPWKPSVVCLDHSSTSQSIDLKAYSLASENKEYYIGSSFDSNLVEERRKDVSLETWVDTSNAAQWGEVHMQGELSISFSRVIEWFERSLCFYSHNFSFLGLKDISYTQESLLLQGLDQGILLRLELEWQEASEDGLKLSLRNVAGIEIFSAFAQMKEEANPQTLLSEAAEEGKAQSPVSQIDIPAAHGSIEFKGHNVKQI